MERTFEVIYHPKVLDQDLKKLSKKVLIQIKISIEDKIQGNPIKFGKHLSGTLKNYFSIRVGNYRIVYEIKGDKAIILICEHRSRVYKEAIKRLF
ncbi:type II toxin-antitoxin system RelE/ParE family toxin [Candidatus Pacebacteria bacterium]|nr:type II toxin-antitoxin system RelE/ParE family toxin [Candidatus Paceibacterota bacterium]